MTIKHLVLSGGGPIMIQLLGAIQHLESTNFIDLKNIESFQVNFKKPIFLNIRKFFVFLAFNLQEEF